MDSLIITRPDDWHLHLRDGDALKYTVADVSRYMGRAIVMPNLVPAIVNTEMARDYQQRIIAQIPYQSSFTPLMTIYLTDSTTPEDIQAAKASGFIYAAKLYPAGATTNSASGVTSIKNIYPVLAALQDAEMPLLLHGEVTDDDIDIFDREKVYLDTILTPVIADFPKLKIVLEHITTAHAVEFVENTGPNIASTITAHHLLYNRNDMLVGGIKPHFYCLPILKRNTHQTALIKAATSGNSKFFLGTDSAPHAINKKESACGCAGAYTSHAAVELYAEVFEQENALDKLEAFTSFSGPDFYELPRNKDTIELEKVSWDVPKTLTLGQAEMVPIRSGEKVHWRVK